MPMLLRGVIVDDTPETARAFKVGLEKTGEVVIDNIFSSASDLLNMSIEYLKQIHFIMTDLVLREDFLVDDSNHRNFTGNDGIDLAQALRRKTGQKKPILIYTAHADDEKVFKLDKIKLISHYSFVYRHQISEIQQLLPIIKLIYKGQVYIGQEVRVRLDFYTERGEYTPLSVIDDELNYKIFIYNGQGLSNKQIQAKCNLEERALQNHLLEIYECLHLDEEPSNNVKRLRAAIMYQVNRLLEWDNFGNVLTRDEQDNLIPYDIYLAQKKEAISLARDHDYLPPT